MLERNKKTGKPKTAWEELLERMKEKKMTPMERWTNLTKKLLKKADKPKTAWELLLERTK